MNTCCPSASLSATAAPAKIPTARGLLASLQTLINQPGLASVDLADTIFASLPRPDGAPYEAVVRTRARLQSHLSQRKTQARETNAA